jgi:hypothetical protein
MMKFGTVWGDSVTEKLSRMWSENTPSKQILAELHRMFSGEHALASATLR